MLAESSILIESRGEGEKHLLGRVAESGKIVAIGEYGIGIGCTLSIKSLFVCGISRIISYKTCHERLRKRKFGEACPAEGTTTYQLNALGAVEGTDSRT